MAKKKHELTAISCSGFEYTTVYVTTLVKSMIERAQLSMKPRVALHDVNKVSYPINKERKHTEMLNGHIGPIPHSSMGEIT